jgi:hypothetical protein
MSLASFVVAALVLLITLSACGVETEPTIQEIEATLKRTESEMNRAMGAISGKVSQKSWYSDFKKLGPCEKVQSLTPMRDKTVTMFACRFEYTFDRRPAGGRLELQRQNSKFYKVDGVWFESAF